MTLVMIFLPVLFILASFAINIAYIECVSTEAQIAADASAKAATRTYISTLNQAAALAAARDAASRNPVGGVVIPINASDLEFGISTRVSMSSEYSFTPAAVGNSVRLTTKSLATSGSPLVQPIFPLFGSLVEIRPLKSATSTQLAIDISLVVDRSGSMAFAANESTLSGGMPAAAYSGWTFGNPVPPNSRWLDLVAAINTFVSELSYSPDLEQVCLASYSNTVSTETALTRNYGNIFTSLNAISSGNVQGATAVGDGMLQGLAPLIDPATARPFASKVMIVMTDGIHNTGTSPIDAVPFLVAEGVKVFSVTFSDEANQTDMETVATIGGGEHFHAVNAAQLQAAFRTIARRLPTLLTK